MIKYITRNKESTNHCMIQFLFFVKEKKRLITITRAYMIDCKYQIKKKASILQTELELTRGGEIPQTLYIQEKNILKLMLR